MTTNEARAVLQAQAPIFAEIEAWSAEQPPITKPPRPYARAAADILADLSKPIAPQHLKSKTKGNAKLQFLPWYHAIRYLDYFAPGWCSEVRSIHWSLERVILTVRLLLPTAEGWLWREATGTSEEPDEGEKMYGDPSSNAESMALRRAAAKFGLGLYLYDRK